MGEKRGGVRKPATKFAHLRKKMERNRSHAGKVTKERHPRRRHAYQLR
jgi:hypothetical protein